MTKTVESPLNANPRAIFIVDPQEILEHPDNMSTDPDFIPNGIIEGWVAYCMGWNGPTIIHTLSPVVIRPFSDNHGHILRNEPCIKLGESEFWFRISEPNHTDPDRKKRPCWYQSGMTLRFIRKRYIEKDE